ncbi:hypothetical protein [Chryseobacterium aurantiacum]|uniref:hypothetical protein n=1 Tax=Chryseobacterium aurantiacum TaxID=2116499 RepID=UPI000D137815|nr:hypothetical protein [Chryseobacterium aurantiacum]
MKELNYQYLLGKKKKEILQELGDELNYHSSDVWSYILKTSLFGKKTILHLYFEDGMVVKWDIIKTYK